MFTEAKWLLCIQDCFHRERKIVFASLKGAVKAQIAYYLKRALGTSAEKFQHFLGEMQNKPKILQAPAWVLQHRSIPSLCTKDQGVSGWLCAHGAVGQGVLGAAGSSTVPCLHSQSSRLALPRHPWTPTLTAAAARAASLVRSGQPQPAQHWAPVRTPPCGDHHGRLLCRGKTLQNPSFGACGDILATSRLLLGEPRPRWLCPMWSEQNHHLLP